MKKLLITIILIFLIGGCSKEPVNSRTLINRNVNGNEVYYEVNGQKPFTGNVFDLYDNGNKKQEGSYKLGQKHGKWTYYYADGSKKRLENYVKDKKNGKLIEWYANGQKETKGNYKDNEKDGFWTLWHENGQKQQEVNWKVGEKVGTPKEWHQNGDIQDGDVESALRSIYYKCQWYYQSKGQWPNKWNEFESYTKRYNRYDLDESLILKWTFDLKELPDKLIATSTGEMKGGYGKVISYDNLTGEYSGYGQQ